MQTALRSVLTEKWHKPIGNTARNRSIGGRVFYRLCYSLAWELSRRGLSPWAQEAGMGRGSAGRTGTYAPQAGVLAATCSPFSVGVAVGVLVDVAVGVAVGVLVDVAVGVAVGVLVDVAVGVAVGVDVGVLVGVAVGVSVGVEVAVAVGVSVGVAVGLPVGVSVAVSVAVLVTSAVSVAVAELVALPVGDGVPGHWVAVGGSTTTTEFDGGGTTTVGLAGGHAGARPGPPAPAPWPDCPFGASPDAIIGAKA